MIASLLSNRFIRRLLYLDNTKNIEKYSFKRLQVLIVLSLIGSAATLVLIAFDATPEAYTRNGITIIVFLSINMLARRVNNPEIVLQLGMAAFVLSATYGLFGSAASRTVMWSPVFPFIAFLFLKMRGVIQWNVVVVLINLSLVFFANRGDIELMVETRILVYATLLNVISSALLVGYQFVSGSYERDVIEQQLRVEALNDQYKTELENSQALAENLSRAHDKSAHDLEILVSTKAAMLSVLEDAKEFQEELEKEKNNVEKKVKRRTAQLRNQKSNLTASIEGLSNGYLMISADQKNSPVFNAAFLKIIDVNHSENVKLKVADIYSILQKRVNRKVTLKEKVEKCIKSGDTFHIDELVVESVVYVVDGSPIYVAKTEEIIGCVMLFTDMTEARELERSKNEFISIASHELRTPLTAIRGNATLLKDIYGAEIKDPDAMEVVDDIKDASIRLISVVNGFLDMSRIEQNKIQLDIASMKPNKQIKAAVDALSGLATNKKLKIVSEVPDTVPNILADSQRFLEIMSNLIDNAIKYSDKGSIIISCEVTKESVTFLVTDSGKGIPEESKKHMFKKFRQAGNNIYTRDVSQSTGLGLYICKMLAEQMKGEVSLRSSTEGKGSTFALVLPIDTMPSSAGSKG